MARWPNAPNFGFRPPEIFKIRTLVAQIHRSGNSKCMGTLSRGPFGPLKVWPCYFLGHHINFASFQHCIMGEVTLFQKENSNVLHQIMV